MESNTSWLCSSNIKMLEEQILCDVELSARNGEQQCKIRCHKSILASRSPVFRAMFCGPLAESKEVIEIPDIEEPVLNSFVRYMYSGMVDITTNTVMHILYAAKKYDVPDLQSKCRSFLEENMCDGTVCTILNQSIVFDDEELLNMCLKFILEHSDGVLKSDSFIELSKSALKTVLMRDTFGVSEGQLFLACKRWAQHACESSRQEVTDENLRQTLGEDLVNLIRFPAMPLKDFSDYVASGTFLSRTETLDVFRSIADGIKRSSFNNQPRIDPLTVSTKGSGLEVLDMVRNRILLESNLQKKTKMMSIAKQQLNSAQHTCRDFNRF